MSVILLSGIRLFGSQPLGPEQKAAIAVGLGCFLAFVIWLLLLSRLLSFLPRKVSFAKIMLWTFIIPGFNLLWVPWALLGTNAIVKKIDERYSRMNLFHSSLGIRILSVPILMLYILWFGVGILLWNSLLKKSDVSEMLMLATIVIVCLLIVLMSYLVHLSMFITRIKDFYKQIKKQQHTS